MNVCVWYNLISQTAQKCLAAAGVLVDRTSRCRCPSHALALVRVYTTQRLKTLVCLYCNLRCFTFRLALFRHPIPDQFCRLFGPLQLYLGTRSLPGLSQITILLAVDLILSSSLQLRVALLSQNIQNTYHGRACISTVPHNFSQSEIPLCNLIRSPDRTPAWV